jgi:hypothetical protein
MATRRDREVKSTQFGHRADVRYGTLGHMQIRIEAHDLPGRHRGEHRNVHVGVQRRGDNADILDPVRADAASASWQFEVTPTGSDLRGPYVQGRPGDRFIYLSWGTFEKDRTTFTMFGRSKLLLAAIDPDTLASAAASGLLVGRLGLKDDRGRVRLAAIKPPAIVWRAG